jgi:hypothetical protein
MAGRRPCHFGTGGGASVPFSLVARKNTSSRVASPARSENFGHGSVDDFSAVLQNQNMRTDFLNKMEQVRTDDDGGAIAGPFQNGILHAPDANRIKPGQRFVEVNDAGRVKQPAGDGEFLFHAAREFARQRVFLCGKLQLVEQLRGDRLIVGHLINARGEGEVLPDGEVIEQSRFVGEECELLFGWNRIARQIVVADADCAASGGNDSGQASQG